MSPGDPLEVRFAAVGVDVVQVQDKTNPEPSAAGNWQHLASKKLGNNRMMMAML